MIINNPKKTVDEEIPALLDYLETEKSHRRGWPRKSYFTNNLMDKTADIFMSYRERADYKFALKLWYKRVITTPSNPFEKSDQTKIESLLANGVLLSLQYDPNQHARVRLFKSSLIRKIKGKTTNKLHEKSCLVV